MLSGTIVIEYPHRRRCTGRYARRQGLASQRVAPAIILADVLRSGAGSTWSRCGQSRECRWRRWSNGARRNGVHAVAFGPRWQANSSSSIPSSLGHGHDAVARNVAVGGGVRQRDGGRARVQVGKGVLEATLQRVGRDGHGGVDVLVLHEENGAVKARPRGKADGVNQNVCFFPGVLSGKGGEEFLRGRIRSNVQRVKPPDGRKLVLD